MMEMRRFLGRLAAFFLLQAVLAAPLGVRLREQPPSRSFLAASIKKHERLEHLASPRIVFVGGSATAFGVDSARVQEALGMPVVNMGLYLPLGMDFMLAEVEPELRSGDVVVVSVEYSLLFTGGSPEALRQLLEVYPAALRWMPAAEVRHRLDTLHQRLGARLKRALRDWLGASDPDPDPSPPYSLGSFNEFGDVIGHHSMPAAPVAGQPYALGPADHPVFRRHLERLNRFHVACVARGVRDYYSYPAVLRESIELERPEFDAVVRELERSLDMPKLHGSEEMLFPAALFFDSKEHLTLEGKTRRTELLIRSLRARLGR